MRPPVLHRLARLQHGHRKVCQPTGGRVVAVRAAYGVCSSHGHSQGYTLNNKNLYKYEGGAYSSEHIACASEKDIFDRLQLPYMAPEEREATDEFLKKCNFTRDDIEFDELTLPHPDDKEEWDCFFCYNSNRAHMTAWRKLDAQRKKNVIENFLVLCLDEIVAKGELSLRDKHLEGLVLAHIQGFLESQEMQVDEDEDDDDGDDDDDEEEESEEETRTPTD
mmetsp:Transcript_45124/g.127391  ORF Transcript_45124/g.127391 Transcript_45124/m.127391 type:complete len:221 (+) Transcript_45124:765-1427(+)